MADIEVAPATFTNVSFDASEIERIAATLADQAGVTVPVRIEVDESTPAAKVRLRSIDPVVIGVESGALEDTKRPRQLGEHEAADALGRALFKVADRLDPAFGAPSLDEEIPMAQQAAWDTYAVGRMVRLGYRPQRQRRVYTFELRHGFSDAALAAFEQLWNAETSTWAEIVGISDEARAASTAA
ncbi:MAG: hypothetical protein ACXIVQ_03130 [Acidimicrobiales bacterium]